MNQENIRKAQERRDKFNSRPERFYSDNVEKGLFKAPIVSMGEHMPATKTAARFFNQHFYGVDFNCWIAGGAMRGYYSDEKIKDIDVFFPNRENIIKMVKYLRKKGARYLWGSMNSITMAIGDVRYDLVKILMKSPADTIAHFDFTCVSIATNGIDVWHHPTAFADLAKKRLVLQTCIYPLSTMERIVRYTKRGYWCCNGTLLTLARAIRETDIDDTDNNPLEFYPDGSARFVRFD